ncbi:MAG: DUF1150 domain-containing protein [Holosporales bacterium]|jgi:hypothetical protein|nr:DUF1150 domain-containing protein [Holosporales bacterium]
MGGINVERLRLMTPQELASLGVTDIAYIKPIRLDRKRSGFALCAADGTTIGFSASQDMALRTAHKNNLIPQSLH